MNKNLSVIQDPLIKAVRKAYRASATFKIDELLAAESRWKRKVTIAQNKLFEVRERINKLTVELARKADGPIARVSELAKEPAPATPAPEGEVQS